ncbi:unnamed protein product [Hymenolepis diminuta]|uniref:Transmembrane protein n=1 Tax=Hymenolepis diminuta TaxID=6216 RepID=A0A0R3SVR4_HYMDI|nr:unnamed protein product [Hymenolepis diminuta]
MRLPKKTTIGGQGGPLTTCCRVQHLHLAHEGSDAVAISLLLYLFLHLAAAIATLWSGEEVLAEARKTAKKQPIASSSMPSIQEILATFGSGVNATQVSTLNPECSEVEIKLQLPERECTNVFLFQDKLVFIGGWPSKNEPGLRRLDGSLDRSSAVSSVHDKEQILAFGSSVEGEEMDYVSAPQICCRCGQVKVEFKEERNGKASPPSYAL